MKFKEKLKQKFSIRCAECGYVNRNSITQSFSSKFFHDKLCACAENVPQEQLALNPSSATEIVSLPVAQIASDATIDLGSKYRILEQIGQGGMGNVYKALDKSNNQSVAIKVLRKDLAMDKTVVKRFEQEAFSVLHLSHPNLVSIKALEHASDGTPYIMMEYIEGESLADLIKKQGHLSASETVGIISQVVRAVVYAHEQGIVHRDLKPSNILLSQSENGIAVKVVDFGIAKALADQHNDLTNLTKTGEIFGSPAYMSPEQCLGEEVDERSDIYSLGCVMYEMLTGRSAFIADNPMQAILKHIEQEPEMFEIEFAKLKIPIQLEKIIFKCLRKECVKRYKASAVLEIDLQKLNGQYLSGRTLLITMTVGFIFYLGIIVTEAGLFYGLIRQGLDSLWSNYFFGLIRQGLDSLWSNYFFSVVVILTLATFEYWRQIVPGTGFLGVRITNSKKQPISFNQSVLKITMIWAWVTIILQVDWCCKLAMLFNHGGEFNPNPPLIAWVLLILSLFGNYLFAVFSASKQPIFDRLADCALAYPNVLAIQRKKIFTRWTKRQWILMVIAVGTILVLPIADDKLEKRALRENLIKMQDVVYAVKDVPIGSPISEDALEEREIIQYKVPDDAERSIAVVKNRIAKYGILAGQIVSTHDLAPGAKQVENQRKETKKSK